MDSQAIRAYDLPSRVASYDADMEVMHTNRAKMVQIALEVLPFPRDFALRALDLGVGTAYFTEQVLKRFPNSRVVAVDGAKAMIDLAKTRLGSLAERVQFCIGDFRQLSQLVTTPQTFDAVYSSYALHHLNAVDKQAVIRQARDLLRPGGWFLNADIIVADSPETNRRFQDLRIQGILERAGGRDIRFKDAVAVRRFLDELEARDGDQPLTLSEDLDVLKDAGLKGASVFWLEYRETVCGGWK